MELNIFSAARLLGVDINVNEQKLKQRWRELVKEHHPDKGGDQKFFSNLNNAHELLQKYIKQRSSPTNYPKSDFSVSRTYINVHFEDDFVNSILDQMIFGIDPDLAVFIKQATQKNETKKNETTNDERKHDQADERRKSSTVRYTHRIRIRRKKNQTSNK